jgi:hypothetical protein
MVGESAGGNSDVIAGYFETAAGVDRQRRICGLYLTVAGIDWREFAGVTRDVIARTCRLLLDRCQHRQAEEFTGYRTVRALTGGNSRAQVS